MLTGVLFGNITYLGSLANFCDFYRLVCLKDPITYTCIGVKLLHHYLLRVEKKGKYLFRVSNPTA